MAPIYSSFSLPPDRMSYCTWLERIFSTSAYVERQEFSVPGHVRVESYLLAPLNGFVVHNRVRLWCSLSVFPVFFSFATGIWYCFITPMTLPLLRYKKYPHDDRACIYPASIMALKRAYITHNLAYIRHVLHPEVLTEMQNVITFLITAMSPAWLPGWWILYVTKKADSREERGRGTKRMALYSLDTLTYLLPH